VIEMYVFAAIALVVAGVAIGVLVMVFLGSTGMTVQAAFRLTPMTG
jgi:uncharacterized membrane-anchored protein YhcB (DUF1043 family)